ncbi:Fe-S-cluster-containing hydrogenase component 2 [Sporomusaceae bacterium BoRhaA]|uniref:hydrogenase iron-sulfur subunit n=1 Tax=Pelorhabdus rhamnosifermentans TaxID=2772457 RepID=UPI001C060CE7|nr:hydrogenase iron-sulfur subunit [Pelorhabdus rhamnosifermentans]MBU2703089.1 Fe-S-cluster-containing hydrogenase component 2 [Pelorhabdus rhamnosifermentans]
MNIAIVGKSGVNKLLYDQFLAEGYTPILIENVNEVVALHGEVGAFSICTLQGTLEVSCIVFAEQAKTSKSYGENQEGQTPLPTISLLEANYNRLCEKKNMPIVFLMDYPTESPAFMTRIAIAKALKIAGKRRTVIYLTRFVRTAEKGLENLYSQARIAGVVFVKYNKFSAEYNWEADMFTLQISDGYEDLTLNTSALISSDKIMINESIDKAASVLKLKSVQGGVIDNNRSFLFPDYTNRKGIHVFSYADNEFQGEELALRIKSIVSNVKNDFNHLTNHPYAQVDPTKCTVCYTCYRVCPHAAMVLDNEISAMKNLQNNCYACGICVSVCPAGAISIIKNDKVEKSSSNKTGKLKIFCCENSGEIAIRKLYNQLLNDFESIDITAIVCGGDLSAAMILSALQDYTKVLVAVCIDEACQHFEGNQRAVKQVERVKGMLDAAGMDTANIEVVKLSNAMPQVVFDYISSMV